MSVKQLLRESGIFYERSPQQNGTISFTVNGFNDGPTLYVLPSDSSAHFRVGAFEQKDFPNNLKLLIFLGTYRVRMDLPSNSNHGFVLSREHIPEAIEIIRQGL